MILTNSSFLTSVDYLNFWRARPVAVAPKFSAIKEMAQVFESAKRVSGCHWELYEANMLRGLRDKASSLHPADRELFLELLASHDIKIDGATIAAAERAERECRSAIAQSEL
ncbi:hypothetical protein ACSSUR_28090 [Pseudomonas cedrina]|uniref:hypothetical protein n=1 Tax=Pseudomonas cedrina TaxID=651740 RepID=UPI003ED93C49